MEVESYLNNNPLKNNERVAISSGELFDRFNRIVDCIVIRSKHE